MFPDTVGILLAGGLSRRMGVGDKTLCLLGGRPILDHVIARARPQVGRLILNANGDPARFASFGLPVIADAIAGHAGPLAGILTGLEWLSAHAPEARWLASFPADAPFLPHDLVVRLRAGIVDGGAEIACAVSAGRSHPVLALWPQGLAGELRRAMIEDGARKVEDWIARRRLARVEFSAAPSDPFFNVNRPADLAEAERLLGRSRT
ncbi:MAG: molybdenum cofactor guanylyltransferase MobA [Alphaproteobacteria bacterium]